MAERILLNQNCETIENWSNDVIFVSNGSFSHYENSSNLYECKTLTCAFDARRYVPTNSIYPDNMNCPLCGSKMSRYGLPSDWHSIDNKIKEIGAGQPDGYELAKQSMAMLKRIMISESETSWPYEVFALDYLLDVAPKINDQDTIKYITAFIDEVNLEKYKDISDILAVAYPLQVFIKTNISNIPQRQVDLCKILSPLLLKDKHPNYTDPTWHFYVWRQFGLVKCEKKGRYNYIFI